MAICAFRTSPFRIAATMHSAVALRGVAHGGDCVGHLATVAAQRPQTVHDPGEEGVVGDLEDRGVQVEIDLHEALRVVVGDLGGFGHQLLQSLSGLGRAVDGRKAGDSRFDDRPGLMESPKGRLLERDDELQWLDQRLNV